MKETTPGVLAITVGALVVVAVLGACKARARENPLPLPKDFVAIKNGENDIIIEARYFGNHNFLGERVDGYQAPRCVLTRQAAQAVLKVQKEVRKENLTLKIYDCYRPQRAVSHFVRWAKDLEDTKMKKEFYPDVDKKNLFNDGYIASKSGHSRGSTIDLTLVPFPVPRQAKYQDGQELVDCRAPYGKRFKDNSLDMGTGFDCFDPLSHTDNPKNRDIVKKNRNLLRTAMKTQGFENYDKEWWHYTLKNEPYPNRYFDFVIR